MNRIKKMTEDCKKFLAQEYLKLIDVLELQEYKTTSEIVSKLNICDRQWRKIVEDMQHLYLQNLLPKIVVGTRKGYIYTNDMDLVKKVLKSKENQFKSMAYNTYHLKKLVMNSDNLTINDYLKEIGGLVN